MTTVIVTSQAELDAAVEDPEVTRIIVNSPSHVRIEITTASTPVELSKGSVGSVSGEGRVESVYGKGRVEYVSGEGRVGSVKFEARGLTYPEGGAA